MSDIKRLENDVKRIRGFWEADSSSHRNFLVKPGRAKPISPISDGMARCMVVEFLFITGNTGASEDCRKRILNAKG